MNKSYYLYLPFFFSTLSAPVASQDDAFIAPLAEQSVLLDLDADSFTVVVGERGHVLTSDDNINFQQRSVPTQSTLTAVTTLGDNVWAVGHDAVIIHSKDRGATWEIQNNEPERERPFLDVEFFDNNNGIAVGAYGIFYRTANGGKSWAPELHAELLDPLDQEYLEEIREESEEFYQEELASILPHLNRVTINGDELLLAGESGLLAKSSDRGISWQRLDANYAGSFFDLTAINPPSSEYIAVGLRGNAFYSNGGEQWQKIQTCTSATLNTIAQFDEQGVMAVGNNGAMVSLSLPISDALNAPESVCGNSSSVSMEQTEDKSAVISIRRVGEVILAVTADGIKKIVK